MSSIYPGNRFPAQPEAFLRAHSRINEHRGDRTQRFWGSSKIFSFFDWCDHSFAVPLTAQELDLWGSRNHSPFNSDSEQPSQNAEGTVNAGRLQFLALTVSSEARRVLTGDLV